MKLVCRAGEDQTLLLRLVGITQAEGIPEELLLIGTDDTPPHPDAPYLRLPDPQNPDAENDALARLLGRAIGAGKVHL
ncbi:hypothetical protein [Motiliproteus sp. SC1-56]|uniref:hypothetical protein n=1 Tax=Motiliproteus sp. SC1-56 TaxID=2799565 RepID=UPI001A8FE6C2|nr:hypothetical protein [Motiliproteus sp. SC1-56]